MASEEQDTTMKSNVDSNQPDETKDDIKQEEIKQDIITIPSPSDEIINKLTEEMKKLYAYNQEASTTIQKQDGLLSFYPTPKQFLDKLGNRTFDTTKTTLGEMLTEQECVRPLVYSNPDDDIVLCNDTCSFIQSAITAWSQHYPFRMKPEHICIKGGYERKE
eukprot:436024_1